LEFSTDSTFATINKTVNAATTSKTAAGLNGFTKYYWRVVANNGGHESSYSNVFSFTTVTAGPLLVSPVDSATGLNLNPVFTWDPVAGANNYTLQVAKFATFTSGVLVVNEPGITGLSYQILPLLANNKYFWRVQSFNGSVAGNYSAKYVFNTGTTLGLYSIKGNTKAVEIKSVYPNPSKDFITVECFLKTPATLTLSVINTEGKTVYTNTIVAAANQLINTIDVSKLPKGVYVISAQCNGTEAKEKIEVW